MTTPQFRDDDEAAQHWLIALRDGDRTEKIEARDQLSRIFERRGMLEEATELLEGNGRAGVRTRELFTRLAGLYRQIGRNDDAIAASAEAAILAKPVAAAAEPAPAVIPPAVRTPPRKRSTIRLVGFGCLGCGGLAVLGLVALVAIGSQLPKPAATPTVVAAQPTAMPTTAPPAAVVEAPKPTAVPPPPEPTAAPAPTLTRAQAARATTEAAPKPEPKPATPAPSPLMVAFTGEFEPKLLKVGQKLVIKLGIENKSDRPIEGLRVFTTGPWGKYTVANVLPNGRFESGMLGYNVYSPMTVPPGQTRFINIVAYPNEPGNHEFSFIPNRDTEALKDEKGQGIVIGGTVGVTR